MIEKNLTTVSSWYHLNNECYYHELLIAITPQQDVYIDGWIGAALRNNFLYAAENTQVTDLTLRELLNKLPLAESHPLYKQLKGGFPKGYGIHLPIVNPKLTSYQIKKNEVFKFSLILYGFMANYYCFFIEAFQKLCDRGFGHPMVSFNLLSVDECDKEGALFPVFKENKSCIASLNHPIHLADFNFHRMKKTEKSLEIQFNTPITLLNNFNKRDEDIYIDRQHEMPGFYTLVRAAANRIIKLNTLYIHTQDADYYDKAILQFDQFLQYAVTPILSAAQIERQFFWSTAKTKKQDRIHFSGYTGQICYQGNFNYYLPLLLFAQKIGVGNHAGYGLGDYRITTKQNEEK